MSTHSGAPPLLGLVLAGGFSTRMGHDKAALAYGRSPQLRVAFDLMAPFVARGFVSVRADQRDDPLRAPFPHIADTMTSIGPAAGLLAAHAAQPDAAWLVLACDLPHLDAGTLETLCAARDGLADAVAFRSSFDDLPEPLCTIWEPPALDALRAQVAAGKICPRKTLLNVNTRLLAPRSTGALDNINTPEERARALARMSAPCP